MRFKIAIVFVLSASWSSAFAQPTQQQVAFFENKIRPVLAEHCYECHNSHGKDKGGLALDYRAPLLAGGDSGEVIVPGKPDESVLIWALRHEQDYDMPAKAPKLDDSVIADFERWVQMGAPDPRLTKPKEDASLLETPWEETRATRSLWWAFQPLRDSSPPKTDHSQWKASPIDRFVYDQIRKQGLTPSDEASPEVLVRRLHLVLTGLPPTPQVVRDFMANPSRRAYRQIVDDLLASQDFGKRWARYWMDWYRYAESHGSEGDPPIPYAHAYRDYLIRALNADVRYDQLLREHLAGDLLKTPRINEALGLNESAIGPAHFRMSPLGFGVTDAYGEQITFTDNQVDVISKAMLGVTVSCARCHNHKFDPISQKDFYRFYGVMVGNRASTVVVDSPAQLNTNKSAITSLKKKIRADLASHWLTQVDQLGERLRHSTFFDQGPVSPRPKSPGNFKKLSKDEQAKILKTLTVAQAQWDATEGPRKAVRSTTHPLSLWAAFTNAPPGAYPGIVAKQLAELNEIKKRNVAAKLNAKFYIDLRKQETFDAWYASGNGVGPRVSPPGSFALAGIGDKAVAGIYPAGIYSHLISDKHAAVLGSGNFRALGKQTMVRAAGRAAELRVPIRNYPLTHGGLHPATPLDNPSLQWMPVEKKWGYWQGEQVHYELKTSREIIPRSGNADRSWFGIAEVIAGDENMADEGAALLDLTNDVAAIADQNSLLKAYVSVLKRVLLHWRDGAITDQEAIFLEAFVQLGFVDNQLNHLPDPLKQRVNRYRSLESEIPIPTRAPGLLEAEPVNQPLLVRGEYKKESDPVKRQFLEIFSDTIYTDEDSGRLALANDMVSDANTLKTRVLVNRLWASVFGRGIVASTDNLGRLGKAPTHPELLDYLALDFERSGWSIKDALRKMVTSRAFRSSSQIDQARTRQDPENLYLSYFLPRRLDAEAIYDSVQFLGDHSERAVYLPVVRNKLHPFLAAFNAPIPTSSVSYRNNTNVPAQSLTMMNGQIVDQAAQRWAKRVTEDSTLRSNAAKIRALIMQAYGREPLPGEVDTFVAFQKSQETSAEHKSFYRVAHAILNSKEFIYVH